MSRPQEPGPLALTRRRGRVELRMVCVAVGRDLAVTLGGGDQAHIGAVAVSQPRPSHAPGAGTSASTSVITLPGHKEDDLAKAIASRLAASLNVVACAACGVHLDHILQTELTDILEMAEELTDQLIARLTVP